ncbi:MAG: BMP family ABC transporter substrate-binding protein [Chloroflexi bacterium]|nr:BMP family ABC transporter substrate-binding protein [Chloroflexota bacterium]
MVRKQANFLIIIVTLLSMALTACNAGSEKVCIVLDTGGENDKGFNEYSLKGARNAAAEVGLEFAHVVSSSDNDYGPNIDRFIKEECDLIMTVGFLMGDVTAEAAKANPDVHFAIIDLDYAPGSGCSVDVSDCYTKEGGLNNVTSLMFAEDEVGYLAGTLAACMSETGAIGSVAGMEIPPVVRFVTGYQNGAKAFNPDIETFNEYVPDFNDPVTGKQLAEDQIRDGADVIFGVGGNTGNAVLLAAHEAGLLAIGVDVDQYNTFPDVAPSLLTSAMKNVDVAAGEAVRAFANDALPPGVLMSNMANDGIGLAPYHDLGAQVSDACRMAVDIAASGLRERTIDTGYAEP